MSTDETTFDLTRKKKSKKRADRAVLSEIEDANASVDPVSTVDVGSNDDFTYEFLLDRAIGENPLRRIEGINLPPPDVGRIGRKRTCIRNIDVLSRALKRPVNMLQDYFSVELGTTVSTGDSFGLTVRARLTQTQVETILRSFIREYVCCKNCHSPSTLLKKEDRLTIMDCQTCHSNYTVQNIRAAPCRRTNDN